MGQFLYEPTLNTVVAGYQESGNGYEDEHLVNRGMVREDRDPGMQEQSEVFE